MQGVLPEMPPGTGSLVWLWRKLWKLPGTAATISLSILLWSLILFQRKCLKPVLQHCLLQHIDLKVNAFLHLFAFSGWFDHDHQLKCLRCTILKKIKNSILAINMQKVQQKICEISGKHVCDCQKIVLFLLKPCYSQGDILQDFRHTRYHTKNSYTVWTVYKSNKHFERFKRKSILQNDE